MTFGSTEDQLTRYRNFDSAYRRAVRDELDMGLANASKKGLLEGALNPNSTIDLSLISNLKVREQLRIQFHSDVLRIEQLVRNAGVPGVQLPSTNALGRRSAMYSTTTAGGYSPVLDLLENATFSIDPMAEPGMYVDPLLSLRMRNNFSSVSFGIGKKSCKSKIKKFNGPYS